MSYLHEKCRIIHTDIKPENILIKVDENYIKTIISKTEKFTELGIDMPRSYGMFKNIIYRVSSKGWVTAYL